MNRITEDLVAKLRSDWCGSFSAQALPDGQITFTSPFLFGDGDGFPLILRASRGGWELTDGGITAYQFVGEDFRLTASREEQIARYAEALGFEYRDNTLIRTLENPPTVEDLADLVSLVAQVSSLPLSDKPRETDRIFRTRATERTRRLLAHPEEAEAGWKPPRDRGHLFAADLYIPATGQPPVATFFAADSEKAERSVNTIVQYGRWDLGVRPLLVHPGGLSSDVIYRAQTLMDDISAVIEVDEKTSVGYAPLRRGLAARGVAVLT